MKDSYRLSVNGGHIIGNGNLYTIALNVIAYRKPGRTLYVRSMNDPTVVAEIRDHDITYTQHGVVADAPDWGIKLQQLTKETP